MIVPKLDKEQEARIAWKASDQTSKRPFSAFTEALQDRVNDLQVDGWDDLDMEIALLAVRSYARRNFVAHSKAYDLNTSKNFQELGQYLEDVDKHLEAILPDEEMPLVDKYRRILAMYRDKHIRKEDGEWKDAKTLAGQTASAPTPSDRPSRSAIRSSMDMGEFRPPGLAGPPPSNVSHDAAAFRRHTMDEPRGTKRPAVEQLIGQHQRKRVAVSDKSDTRTEPQQEPTDKIELETAKSLAAVHAILEEWRQVGPERYLIMLNGQKGLMTRGLSKAISKTVVRGKKKTMREAK